jgi:hypothetical protein
MIIRALSIAGFTDSEIDSGKKRPTALADELGWKGRKIRR